MPEYYLGIDVGYAEATATTGLCLITVDQHHLQWQCLNTVTDRNQRLNDLRNLIPQTTILNGVGIDGPLTRGLAMVNCYRPAEALLSRSDFQGRCQPGQTNSGNGQKLHHHATQLAQLVLALQQAGHLALAGAIHPDRIHQYRIVEAFPDAFLAFLLSERDFPVDLADRARSDTLWEIAMRHPFLFTLMEHLSAGSHPNLLHTLAEHLGTRRHSYMRTLIEHLAPGRRITRPLEYILNHDHRAAFICAVSAMCVATNEYVAAGAPGCGDIILPPREVWGADAAGQGSWAEPTLQENVVSVRGDNGQNNPCLNFNQARVISNGQQWMPEQQG